MASYNENWLDGSCSYFDDPFPYCGGPHSWQNCLKSLGGGLCAQSRTHEWSICDRCGGQNDHWANCAYVSFPSPNPHYDDSTFCCDNDREMEVEEVENGQNGEFKLKMECLLKGGNEKQKALEEYLETSLQNGLMNEYKNLPWAFEQNQEEFSNAQYEERMPMLEANREKEESRIENPPNESIFIRDAKEEKKLESTVVLRKMMEVDSSLGENENVKIRKNLQIGRLKSHSKHFSTLDLYGDMGIEPHTSMLDGEEERQVSYILQFERVRRQNDIPHLKAKKCKMKKLTFGLFIYLPPPHERHHDLDSKLERKFISSKWKEKW
ncbi:uncharacterized protein LOC132616800 isoform X1 [Lycium barbarum]|uniref:uncharacterized protein LOC132616800 isoform X1 n=1 Tax=Lycium barbarum TaxID=112863 RepID=UPI00293EB558|nr:uncharacterized protein LOC132616800 isoform X1 [Lycium barbarum]